MPSSFHPSSASRPSSSRRPSPPRGAPRRAAQPSPVAAPVPPAAVATVPAGTFSPGTKIQVGRHRVVIQKYLSEGGFAHVYLVKLPSPVAGTDLAVLKRVAVPDKDALRSMRTEVETMKRLKGHRSIVTYIDSHASELRGGGYEVFLLMEYCNGGGLIDFMNTRLQHRLTEPEILAIFADIAEGVACMHYLKPPLLHRDLKVENVLITDGGRAKRFKLCDFGSAAPPCPAPTTVADCRLLDEDIQKHTTLQYRSPEMIDVYRRQPVNEKADIWALGVLLYKLCYYTTPFEDQGQLAILNASYRYPSYPAFSDRIKKLIASMLKESLQSRPTIYQVLKEACVMQGREIPISDIYTSQEHSDASSSDKEKLADSAADPAAVGAVFAPSETEKTDIPKVVPMRRGRPSPSPSPGKSAALQSKSSAGKVTEGDPFAALDTTLARKPSINDPSSRFPSLTQFSLLHDQGSRFSFQPSSGSTQLRDSTKDSDVTSADRLAGQEAISSSRINSIDLSVPRPHSTTPLTTHRDSSRLTVDRPEVVDGGNSSPRRELGRAASTISENPEIWAMSSEKNPRYISTGTMTVERLTEKEETQAVPHLARDRSGSHSNNDSGDSWLVGRPKELLPGPQLDGLGRRAPPSPSRRSPGEVPLPGLANLQARQNTLGGSADSEEITYESSTVEFLRREESLRSKTAHGHIRRCSRTSKGEVLPTTGHMQQDVDRAAMTGKGADLLVAVEDSESESESESESGADSSAPVEILTTVPAAPSSKVRLRGKFGDAFNRFEKNGMQPSQEEVSTLPALLEKKLIDDSEPVAVTKPSELVASQDDNVLIDLDDDEDETTNPEKRREMERRQLQEEEQRVAAAQADYRNRSVAGAAKASSIQRRVQSLLQEDSSSPRVQRTAEGYGKYSDALTAASKAGGPVTPPAGIPKVMTRARPEATAAATMRAGVAPNARRGGHSARTSTAGLRSVTCPKGPASKPAAPRKPVHLNSFPVGGRALQSPTKGDPQTAVKAAEDSGVAVAADERGKETSKQEKDDYMEDFSKRFPSLSAIETETWSSRATARAER